MKKLAAFMLTILMLACALPALAEDASLHTFAGIPWDTPADQWEAMLEANTGVDFRASGDSDMPTPVILAEGAYSMLSMPVEQDSDYISDSSGFNLTFLEDGTVEKLLVFSEEQNAGAENNHAASLDAAEQIAGRLAEKYGAPTSGYFCYADGYEYDDYLYYIVPQEELPYLIADALVYPGDNGRTLWLVYGNVVFCVEKDSYSSMYHMSITYLPNLATFQDIGHDRYYEGHFGPDENSPEFPIFNGEVRRIVIEP